MGRYRLVFEKSLDEDLRDISKKDVAGILKCLEGLSEDPRAPGCERLSARERYRVRWGSYRIVYEIEDDALIVVVVKVGHGFSRKYP